MATKQNSNSESTQKKSDVKKETVKKTSVKSTGTAKSGDGKKTAAKSTGAKSTATKSAGAKSTASKSSAAKVATAKASAAKSTASKTAAKSSAAGAKTSTAKKPAAAKTSAAAKTAAASKPATAAAASASASAKKTSSVKPAASKTGTAVKTKTAAAAKPANSTALTSKVSSSKATSLKTEVEKKLVKTDSESAVEVKAKSEIKSPEAEKSALSLGGYEMLLAGRKLEDLEQEHKSSVSEKSAGKKNYLKTGIAVLLAVVVILVTVLGIRGCSSKQHKSKAKQNVIDAEKSTVLDTEGFNSDVNGVDVDVVDVDGGESFGFEDGALLSAEDGTLLSADEAGSGFAGENKSENKTSLAETNAKAGTNAKTVNKTSENKALEQNKKELEKARKEAEKQKAEEERIRAQQEKENRLKQEQTAFRNGIENKLREAEAYLNSGNLDAALKIFSEIEKDLENEKDKVDSAYKAKVLGSIGLALQSNSEGLSAEDAAKARAEAQKYASKTLLVDGANAESHYVFGEKSFLEKDFAAAEKEFQNAVATDSSNPTYYYQLGRTFAQRRKFAEAKTSFNSCIKFADADVKFTKKAEAYYNLGVVCASLNQPKEALANYRKAYEVNNNYEKAYLAAGRLLNSQGDYYGAINAFSEALRISPNSASNFQERAGAYSNAGNKKLALDDYKKALSYGDPKDPITNYNISTTLYDLNNLADSLNYAKTAYDNKKEDAKLPVKIAITYNYALVNQSLKNTEDAIRLYREVLGMDANHVKSNINLGSLCLELNDADIAIKYLSRAYEKEPSNFEVNNNLGNAYRLKSDYENSITYYKNALRIDQKNNTVRENLAKAYASSEQYDFAKSTYEDVIKNDKTNYDAMLALAKVCISLKDNAEAEKYLLELKNNAPSFEAAEVDRLLNNIWNSGN